MPSTPEQHRHRQLELHLQPRRPESQAHGSSPTVDRLPGLHPHHRSAALLLTTTHHLILLLTPPTRPSIEPLCNVKTSPAASFSSLFSIKQHLAVSLLLTIFPSRRRSFPAFLAVTQPAVALPPLCFAQLSPPNNTSIVRGGADHPDSTAVSPYRRPIIHLYLCTRNESTT